MAVIAKERENSVLHLLFCEHTKETSVNNFFHRDDLLYYGEFAMIVANIFCRTLPQRLAYDRNINLKKKPKKRHNQTTVIVLLLKCHDFY